MALFKPIYGESEHFNETNVPLHAGYAYLLVDTGEMFADFDIAGAATRVQVNAKYARWLRDDNGNQIEIDDIVLVDDVIDTEHGGTGLTDIAEFDLIVGDAPDNGKPQTKLLSPSAGALYFDNTGLHFGTLPLTAGGTGAVTAAGARTNLSVYSTDEVDDAIKAITVVPYDIAIAADDWEGEEAPFSCVKNVARLMCGATGDVPPMIVLMGDNYKEYAKVTKATADPVASTVTFEAEKRKPEELLELRLIDYAQPV